MPPIARPDVQRFLDYLNALPGPRTHEVEPAQARDMMRRSRELADAAVGELAAMRDIPGGPVPMRLFDARADRGSGPVMIFYHGGGWVLGDLDTHAPLCAAIARGLDLPVISVDYRLAPEHPFPTGIEDAIAATRWVAGNPAALGLAVTGLVLAGDSAGGNFAIVVAAELRDDPAHLPVLAQWPIYPAAHPTAGFPSFTDFAEGYLLTHAGIRWFDDHYRPDRNDPRWEPMLRPLAGLPPALVQTASLDPIRDQGRAYAARLIEAGVDTVFLEAVGNIHGFMNLRGAIPSSDDDLGQALDALRLILERAMRLPYRPAAGVMLLNPQGQVWVGQRRDSTLEAWQMPQGGLDEGEEPLEGALRELEEETGITRDLVDVIARSRAELDYDLPADLQGKLWGGRWRGQRQWWFLLRFLGQDADVRINTKEPEFRAWRWVEAADLPSMIVPFKRDLYTRVLAEFADHLPAKA